jgi:predicted kinase
MPQLLLIRGLPGSGKTTLAKEVYVPQGFLHFESDDFFRKNGRYAFDPRRRNDARQWCRDQVYEALLAGRDVVVSDNFLSKCEVRPYRDLANHLKAYLKIITLRTQFGSKHITNKALLAQIKSRWQEEV